MKRIPPGFPLAILLALASRSVVEAEDARIRLLPLLPTGVSEAAVSFAGELRRALSAREAAFSLADSPFDADVLVEVRGAGPAGYRRGAEPGSRVQFGCRVEARVTSRGSLPTDITHNDIGCPEAADALLLGIERLVRRDKNEGSIGL